MATAQQVIKNFMGALDTTTLKSTAALDAAVKSVSNFSSWSELTNTLVKDCKAYGDDYQNFLKNACGIILNNDDTGAISGSDAGGSTAKTAASIVPETGAWKYPASNSFTIEGLTVTMPAKNKLDDSQKFIVGALYSWWVKESLDLIKNSFGFTFKESGTSVKKIDVQFYNKNDGNFASISYGSSKKTTKLTLKINMRYYSDIDQNNPNGSASKASKFLDRTIVHEITHAVMAANIDYFSRLPTVFKEGAAELIHGIDDARYDLIKSLASNSSSLQSAIKGSNTATYAAGYILLRYLAKQAAENRDPSKNISVEEIFSDDTISGTSARDIFTYDGGNDVIKKFTSGTAEKSDVLDISGEISKITRSSGKLVFTVKNKGTLTVEAGTNTDKAIQYYNNSNKMTVAKFGNSTSANKFTYDSGVDFYFGGSKKDTLVASGKDDVEINLADEKFSGVEIVDAKNSYGKNFLAGDSAENKILGGKGTSTLWGGGGSSNDTLIGGSGENIFWYGLGEGNDVIQSAKNSDTVNLYNVRLEDLTFAGASGNNLLLSTASGNLTIKGAACPIVQLADGSAYQYDRSKKIWNEK